MAKTLEDWKDAYYEQQALHTEATGILSAQVRRAEAERDEKDRQVARLYEEREQLSRALSKGSRWIPVGEQLPNHKERVIVLDTKEDDDRELGYWDDEKGSWYWEPGLPMSTPPTHWMPLPEAPKP